MEIEGQLFYAIVGMNNEKQSSGSEALFSSVDFQEFGGCPHTS